MHISEKEISIPKSNLAERIMFVLLSVVSCILALEYFFIWFENPSLATFLGFIFFISIAIMLVVALFHDFGAILRITSEGIYMDAYHTGTIPWTDIQQSKIALTIVEEPEEPEEYVEVTLHKSNKYPTIKDRKNGHPILHIGYSDKVPSKEVKKIIDRYSKSTIK